MNDEDNRKMEQYGIKSETQTVYYYKGYRYEHLKDAINYAEIDKADSTSPVSQHVLGSQGAKLLDEK